MRDRFRQEALKDILNPGIIRICSDRSSNLSDYADENPTVVSSCPDTALAGYVF